MKINKKVGNLLRRKGFGAGTTINGKQIEFKHNSIYLLLKVEERERGTYRFISLLNPDGTILCFGHYLIQALNCRWETI